MIENHVFSLKATESCVQTHNELFENEILIAIGIIPMVF